MAFQVQLFPIEMWSILAILGRHRGRSLTALWDLALQPIPKQMTRQRLPTEPLEILSGVLLEVLLCVLVGIVLNNRISSSHKSNLHSISWRIAPQGSANLTLFILNCLGLWIWLTYLLVLMLARGWSHGWKDSGASQRSAVKHLMSKFIPKQISMVNKETNEAEQL